MAGFKAQLALNGATVKGLWGKDGSFQLSGKAALLFLVHPGTEVWAEGLRKNRQPDTARWLAMFFFRSTDGSVRIQWSRVDRELPGLLTIGWIFTPLCNETGVAIAGPGKKLPF